MGMEVTKIEWKCYRPPSFPCMACHNGYAENRARITKYPKEHSNKFPIVFTLCLCNKCVKMTENEILNAVMEIYE